MLPHLWISLRFLGTLALTALAALPAQAQLRSVRLADGLSLPLGAYSPPGDKHRIFIVEQTGKIRVLEDGVLLPTPFLDVTPKVGVGFAVGLLGLAFHPNYVSNGHFFISYTRRSDGASMIERYTASAANPDVADPASKVQLIDPIPRPSPQHNSGCLQFGADDKLYFTSGDGGGAGDSGPGHPAVGNGQYGDTLLGKLLRLDVDIPAPHIPPDNPFVGVPGMRGEIWALGLRNPWRFSFDNRTGDLYLGDVGQGVMEEVDFIPAGVGGLNFGWKCMEGTVCTGLPTCGCNLAAWTPPIEEFDHSFACCVIGGCMYRGCSMPALQGTYFYADYCSGRVFSFTYNGVSHAKGPVIERTSSLTPGGGQAINTITAFGEDGFGELLIVDGDGELYKVISASQIDCNSNGVDDLCDLSAGISLDVNNNDVPDECEGSAPVTYCVGKTSSQGCIPSISSTGYPSATHGSGFLVRAASAINNKPGLVLYGTSGRSSVPFQGGTVCINSPVRRTTGVNSGGAPPPTVNCSGVFTIDFNSFAVGALGGAPSALLRVPGTVVNCQWWGRDSGFPAALASQLSNGLEFQICP